MKINLSLMFSLISISPTHALIAVLEHITHSCASFLFEEFLR